MPINPDKKDTIVDVRCKDKDDRQYIVEMQMYWTNAFVKRALLNTCKAYSMPTERGEDYRDLKSVYTLSLVNDIAFPELDEFYHCHKLTHTEYKEYTIDDILMVFVELKKFSPQSIKDISVPRKTGEIEGGWMMVLWLRFLTEINEHTQHVDEELLQDKNVSKALELIKESAYTDAELYAIDRYWDAVSRERTIQSEKYEKGREDGREELRTGYIKRLRSKGYDDNTIADLLELSIDYVSRH